jgi:diguanylate cyclase (GGDEF)-like protein
LARKKLYIKVNSTQKREVTVETLKTMDVSILSFIILIFIYFNAYNRYEKALMQYKLFIALVQTNMALVIIDILGWIFNGQSGYLNIISNTGFNLLLYVMEPVGPILWVLYTNFQVFRDESRIRKLKCVLFVLFSINALASVISINTGWFFSIDANNIYHRGQYFWIHVMVCFSFLIYSSFFILFNRHAVEKRYYYSLLLFAIPQIIGSSLQSFFYGLSLNWTVMMLSLLIIYFNIQDRGLNTDYLTGVYNRRQLDSYIKDKISYSAEEKSFSAILIDINEFKKINDTFGHDIGDEALQCSVTLIRNCLRSNDFIARFGGDEFYIILDINNRKILESKVETINACIDQFNKDGNKPYKLSFSMGYDVYDAKSKMNLDGFLKHIDLLMYNNKRSNFNKNNQE